MSDSILQALANIDARLARLESKFANLQRNVGRNQSWRNPSRYSDFLVKRVSDSSSFDRINCKFAELRREIRVEAAGTNTKIDLILQRLDELIDSRK